jgi:L-Ala-D/L-Glu epimerase
MGARRRLSVHIEEWAARIPFRISSRLWHSFRIILVEIAAGRHVGRGEGFPVHYLQETAESVRQQIETAAQDIESGADRQALLELMPAGAARNAVDCALWDLEAKCSGKTVWQLTGIEPQPLTTVFTIGLEETPQAMAERAVAAAVYPLLKIKLNEDRPVERVAAIRAARPDAGLVVDPNQAWTFAQLAEVAPRLAQLGVTLIEQPLPRGSDQVLETYVAPIPLSADESCQHRGELEPASRRYRVINIKLDKAGGLTEALLLAQAVTDRGLQPLVSNMGGTSLAMAPAYVLAQRCHYVELDGQLILRHDRFPGLICERGVLSIPSHRLWG